MSQFDELPPVSTTPSGSESPSPASTPPTGAEAEPVATGNLGTTSIEVRALDSEFDYGSNRDPAQEADRAVFTDAVMLESGTIIAAGSDEFDGVPTAAAIWRQTSDGAFTRVRPRLAPGKENRVIGGLSALPNGDVLAIGYAYDGRTIEEIRAVGNNAVWMSMSSDDGTTWTSEAVVDDAWAIDMSTVGDDVYISVVRDPFGDTVFGVMRYREGIWAPVAWPAGPPSFVRSIVEIDDGTTIAVGTRCSAGCSSSSLFLIEPDAPIEPAVWTSVDGETWQAVTVSVADTDIISIDDVVSDRGVLYAIARARSDDVESIRVLRSRDGAKWDVLAAPELEGERARAEVVHVSVENDQLRTLVATSSARLVQMVASIVVVDTETGETTSVPLSWPADIFNVSAVVERDGRLVLFGSDSQPRRPDAVRAEIRVG